jgi:hypothetical protein
MREREREREILFFRLLFLHRAKARVSLESHSEENKERDSHLDCYSFILQRVGFHWNNTQRKTEIERDSLLETLLFLHCSKARVSLESHSKEKSSSPLVSKQIHPLCLSVIHCTSLLFPRLREKSV